MTAPKTIQWCVAHDGPEDWGGDCQPAAMEGHGAACEWGELRVAGPDDLVIRREDSTRQISGLYVLSETAMRYAFVGDLWDLLAATEDET